MKDLSAELAAALSDRYRIQRELGRGGMAVVYLADDLKHRRKVAIKVMLPELAAQVDRDRFVREIDIAARLTHPHILPLHDSGVASGQLYYVTPYIEGESLRARIEREGRLPVAEALRLAREIASALGFAHQQGVVHRDIKPENVLLADNIALVADFGIARAMAAQAVWSVDTTAAPNLTLPGQAVGTLRYIAPEQAAGEDVDGRADLYALGCVLYEMLSGRPPFTANTAAGLIREHMAVEPQPVRELRPEVAAGVAAAIAKVLAKARGDRPRTAAVFAELLSIADSVDASVTPSATHRDASIPGNIPRQRTHFIGRERELEACARLLEETRLLTLTGIGGSGKTRLAIRLAERVRDAFPDGTWFVDLAPIKDPEHVVLATATALGIRESADIALIDAIAGHVADRRLLIILDNCEHVLAASAELVERLLAAGSEVSIVATSREGLGIEGERPFALRSLEVPPGSATALAAIEATDAVRLFIDRAVVVDPGFALTDRTAPVVAEICRRLDGIPLALELAAARVKILSPEQIRARLDDRFRLLTGGSRTAVSRHQALRTALQWSYDQLPPEEQQLLREVSVFLGGWTLELATRASAGQGEFEVMDRLTRLVDKSLVVVDRTGDQEFRYGLLETVRQFAQECLSESGSADDARRRHCTALLAMAEQAYGERFEREEAGSAALEAEHENLRAALEFARHEDPELHLRLAGALAWSWQLKSHYHECRQHLLAALAGTTDTARPARARALLGLANILYWQAEGAEAMRLFETAHTMWRALGDAKEEAIALEGTGWAQITSGQDERALETFRELHRIQRAAGDPVLLNRASVALAQVLVATGALEEARAVSHEIIAYSAARGDRRNEHFGLHFLADCALIEGHYDDAVERYRRSLDLAWKIGDRLETSFEVQGMAMSLAGLGAARQAIRLFAAVEAEWARLGVDPHMRFWDELLERYIGQARASLTLDGFSEARSEGLALEFEQAVQEGLQAQAQGVKAS